MSAWYQSLPLQFNDPQTSQAEALLVQAYPMTYEVLVMAQSAGLDIAALNQGLPPKYLMRDLLQKARAADRLRQFLAVFLSDKSKEAFHPLLLATMPGQEADLRAALLEGKPSLAALSILPPSIAVRLGEEEPSTQAGAFERTINAAAGFADIAAFRRWLTLAEVRTARVLIGGVPIGTGFLVGERLLLTNWHVAQLAGDQGEAQFDFLRDLTGAEVSSGRRVAFAATWDVAHSPPLATSVELSEEGPPQSGWDFALVRLAQPVGAQPIGDPAKGGETRGAFQLDGGPYLFDPDEPLLIVGHPMAGPMQLSYSAPAAISTTSKGARVRYTTNTEPGSSGSPVFNKEFRIVALHHAAKRDKDAVRKGPFDGKYNQGIPMRLIVEELRKQLAGRPEVLAELGLGA